MATKLIMHMRPDGSLVPADEVQAEALDNHARDVDYQVELKRPRSPAHHRLFFALLSCVIDNDDDLSEMTRADATDFLLFWLKVRLGYVDRYVFETGKVYYKPRSIAFASMAQDDFREFFDRALDAIVKRYGYDRPALLDEIEGATGLRWREAA